MYYNECLLILTLLWLNWKLFLENIRKFKDILSSYYIVTSIQEKLHTNTSYNNLQQTKAKMKILMSVFEN